MGKRILILLTVLVALVCVCALTASAAEEKTIIRYCEYCDLTETWYPMDNTSPIETKHYYMSKNVVFSEKVIPDGVTLCLDLNGRTYTGNRRIIMESGATLNVQGEGLLTCRGDDTRTESGAWEPGGCVWVKKGATLNMYSGTMEYKVNEMDRGTSRGGVVAVYGTFNMYGGIIRNGIAAELGGTLYVDTVGRFNMYGGQVLGGSAPNSYCTYSRGRILLANDASIEHAQITPNTNAGVLKADQITIRGNYTGSLCLSVYDVNAAGIDIGNSEDANLENSSIYFMSNDLKVQVSGTDLVTYLPGAAEITSGGSTTSYETLEAALAALQDGDILTLHQSAAEAVTIDKNITLELNGRKLSNTLTAADGVTVFVKDRYTADYNIADGVYGRIKAIEGDIRGVEATESSDPYLMITESKGISFHAVGLNIHSMSLKTGEAALYFNNTFAGDSLVKEQVESFGIAMSVAGEPTKDTMANSKHYTSLEGSLFGTEEGNAGSLLQGIMKEENDQKANQRNAQIEVYGKAYVKLKDGGYLFGICRSRDLKNQVEEAAKQFENLSAEAQDGLRKLIERYDAVTNSWQVKPVYDYMENHEEETLKIMLVGNSGSVDAFHLLYQAFQDQYPDQKIVLGVMYYSGCTIAQHVGFYQKESPVYSYRINRDGNWVYHNESTLQNGLTDQQWDIVGMHANKTSEVKLSDRNLLAQYIEECVPTPHKLFYYYTGPNPNDETFFSEGFDPQPPAGYKNKLVAAFGFDPENQLTVMLKHIKEDILVDDLIDTFVSTGPATMYAINRLGCSQLDMFRDYTHMSDFCRLMASYCWVSQITGEPITEINIDMIPAAKRATFRQQALGDMAVTEEMKQIIITCANHALQNRFDIPLPLE